MSNAEVSEQYDAFFEEAGPFAQSYVNQIVDLLRRVDDINGSHFAVTCALAKVVAWVIKSGARVTAELTDLPSAEVEAAFLNEFRDLLESELASLDNHLMEQ